MLENVTDILGNIGDYIFSAHSLDIHLKKKYKRGTRCENFMNGDPIVSVAAGEP